MVKILKNLGKKMKKVYVKVIFRFFFGKNIISLESKGGDYGEKGEEKDVVCLFRE